MSHGIVAYGKTEKGECYATVVTRERGESRDSANALLRKYQSGGFEEVYSAEYNGKLAKVLKFPEGLNLDNGEIKNMWAFAHRQGFVSRKKGSFRSEILEEIAKECMALPWEHPT